MSQGPSKHPWSKRWKHIRPHGSGGQGTTNLVQRKEDGVLGVLKILKNQGSMLRRERMRRETEVLKKLDHPGFPSLLDTNADQADDTSVRLYLVTEFIDGPTLEASVKSGVPTAAQARQMVLALCDTVACMHGNDVLHRDIKPDNIVLRGGDYGDPVLIDFGLSFNADDPGHILTAMSEQLANRFMPLPELLDGENTRDERTDVALVVGNLFFALTALKPSKLPDEEGRMPHQSREAKELLERIEPHERTVFQRVFDKGLRREIGERYPSIEDVRRALEPYDELVDEDVDIETLRRELDAIDPEYRRRVTFESARNKIMLAIYKPVVELYHELGSFDLIKSPARIDFSTMSFEYRAGLKKKDDPRILFAATFIAKVIGNEIVVVRKDGEQETQICRVPFEPNPNVSALTERVTPFFRSGIYRTLKTATIEG